MRLTGLSILALTAAAVLSACAPTSVSLAEFHGRQGATPISDRPKAQARCASSQPGREDERRGRYTARGMVC